MKRRLIRLLREVGYIHSDEDHASNMLSPPYLGSRESHRLLRDICHTASPLFQADIHTGQSEGHRALDKIR